MSDYDVIVIGGGMVGAAAACVFGARDLKVAVVEARLPDFDLDDGKIGLRVSAVSRASQTLLRRLQVLDRIPADRMAPFRRMRVWDAEVPPESSQVVDFDCAEIGEPDLGFIVENRRILQGLHRRLHELDGVSFFAPASAARIVAGAADIEVRLEDERRLRAQLVIGADGARSRTRELAGIDTRGWSYEQKAVVTHVETARGHDDTAYQRFLPDGPIALLPLYDGRASIVWSTTPEQADRLLQLDAAEFNRAVGVATDHVLGEIVRSDARAAFPLQLLHAVNYVKPRLALIGDAAHAVHPLAGQGVNLGFSDVHTLGAVTVEADDIGDLALLRRYERQRKSDNLLVMGSLDALNRLFRSDAPLVGRARQVGMSLFNRMAPLKHAVIRRAMGG